MVWYVLWGVFSLWLKLHYRITEESKQRYRTLIVKTEPNSCIATDSFIRTKAH